MEPAQVARQFGYPTCNISVGLPEAEAARLAGFSTLGDPRDEKDWAKMQAAFQPGDELRMVSCVSRQGNPPPGYSFIGLFRGNTLVLEMFSEIND